MQASRRPQPDRPSCPVPVPLRIADGAATATATLRLSAGRTLLFALHYAGLGQAPARVWTQQELVGHLESTVATWRSWSQLHQAYEGPWSQAVRHSGRVLQALTFQPSGAIVAAPTTSLPEAVGGERNWDYRYTWVRDASVTMEALWGRRLPRRGRRLLRLPGHRRRRISRHRPVPADHVRHRRRLR
jgi:alpha,alpha-trehalase